MAFVPSCALQRYPPRASMPIPSALDNVRIALTAPAPYAARLIPLLVQKHAKPVWMPSIRTTSLTEQDDVQMLCNTLLQLPSFQVLAFTSRTGMTEVARHLHNLVEDPNAVQLLIKGSGAKVAALGKDATAAKDALGVTADIVPLEASPMGMVSFMAADVSLRGASVLCPIPKVVGMKEPSVVPDFLEALRETGFCVTALPAYETKPVGRKEVECEARLLLGGAVDAMVFSSAGEAWALREILTEQERRDLVDSDVIFAAHGPFAAGGVREALGVEDVVVSEDFSSFQGVIAALERTFKEKYQERQKLVPL